MVTDRGGARAYGRGTGLRARPLPSPASRAIHRKDRPMSYKQKIDDIRDELRSLYKAAPEQTRGFGTLSKAVKETGVLGVKEKECVALGMALVQRCEPCILLHVEALMKAGASREELSDVLAMAIQMSGGPGLMYAAKALACWDELAAAGA
ncbi:carboxymuconolactone decarboxylase family protein [Rhodobacter sphaeroides]|uniref:Carboxymuconolactonedecarboxylase/Alkylhydropero xidase n=2 Tax=Cereibacter sphaeroides TaxID=1063 RepID=Q3HKM0_CERS4|nr:Carboxymuconolactonedecarboxylase/Alkylhydroperoxidase [Cereibacter sphaeroides 2.4.1]AXC63781.1 carboxymuconolactone decarboxylase family protein [Cereibacter sphaeroides 2.4.1]MVX50928.1 carboxymuconolactone decarboxylase family protein [Cereibacter sphaeroides]